MNILLTSAGQRVSLVRAFQKELSVFYPEARVFAADMCPQLSPACHVADKAFTVRRVTDSQYIPELLQLCRANQVKMVVPTIDTELLLLARNKELFADAGIEVIVSSEQFVSQCRDKRLIAGFFLRNGIEVPRPIDKNSPSFPLFVKPFDGSLSADTYLVQNPEDLKPQFITDDRLLFMEYISKCLYDEYTVDMYYDMGGFLKCIVPRKRIHVRAGEISKGITCKNAIIPFLKAKLGFVEGARGCLTLQLFLSKKSDSIVAIEINPRFGGGYPLSYRAGANYPRWLILEYFQNWQVPYFEAWEDQMLMLRYDDEVIVHGTGTIA